jgi:hypothetical protein
VECVACERGKYAPQALTGGCLTCGAGSQTNNGTGSTTCTPCDTGFYSTGGVTGCLKCPGGKYSPSGQSSCTNCAAGSFASEAGSPSCADCPGNYYSTAAATSCTLCLRNFYYTLDGECVVCPIGTDCSVDGGATQELLTIEAGFWRISGSTPVVHACELTEACNGGITFGSGSSSSGSSSVMRRELLESSKQFDSDSYCNEGYTGPLCSTCAFTNDAKFFMGTSPDTGLKACLECGGTKTILTALASPTMIIFFVIIALVCALAALSMVKFSPSLNAQKQMKKLVDQLAKENDTVQVPPPLFLKKI